MTEEREVKGQAALILHASLTYTPHCCAKCGVVNQNYTIIKNGTQESMITLPFHPFKPFYLCLRKQRFYCRSCGKTFMASTHLVNFNCFIANPLKAGVAFEASRAVSYKDIAERFNISWSSVACFARLAAKERRKGPKSLPAHLSFDEFKYKKGKMAFDYIDAATGQILGIVSGRTQYKINQHFISQYSLKDRQQVQTVTIDMNAGYVSCIRELFPQAKIIIDRFHLVQLINRSFNQTRIQYMNQLKSNSSDQKKYRRLKAYWKLFLKKESDLSYTSYHFYRLFGQRTEAGILQEMLAYDPSLKRHYRLYQDLIKAIQDQDMAKLEDRLAVNQEGLSNYMKRSLKPLAKHLPFIENTFHYPYTNGKIEGTHNKIKVLNRIAYGFRNLGNYLDRICLYFSSQPIQ